MEKKPLQEGAGSERLAKTIARAGLASRRGAEAIILAGRVTVNGKRVGVATNVGPKDRVEVDGKPLPPREGARLWLYHKPSGLVTTEKDEQGRPTVFDAVREQLGRVLSVGRLDLTSEGLLLLTNDGDLKRQLELPETGWLRRYRVRVNGHPDEAALERLRTGIEVDGEQFAPMQVALDRTQGANAWLTVGLREGRNREIRRAMEAVGVVVARLIRVSYGPFQLGKLAPGAVEELRPRILRDQLGSLFDGPLAEGRRDNPMTSRPQQDRPGGEDRPRDGRGKGRKRDDGHKEDRQREPRRPMKKGDGGTSGKGIKGGAKGRGGAQSEDGPRADIKSDPSFSLRKRKKGRGKGPKR